MSARVLPPSMTRTEIPSSSLLGRSVSAAAFVRACEAAQEGVDPNSAARIVRSSNPAAIGRLEWFRSEREANMAHTPFVATGWSQQDEERESQGDEQSAGHASLRGPEHDDRSPRQGAQRLRRKP